MTKAAIFVTDYASYNEGTQFEFGHWIDLRDFSDEIDLLDHIQDHLAECDEKRPLECGSEREEIMITDYEGFPEEFYCESFSTEQFEKVYKYLEFIEDFDVDSESDLLSLHWEYCEETNHHDSFIYENTDENIKMLVGDDVVNAIQCAMYGDYNTGSDYVTLDGYGNLQSIHNLSEYIDVDELISWKVNQL